MTDTRSSTFPPDAVTEPDVDQKLDLLGLTPFGGHIGQGARAV